MSGVQRKYFEGEAESTTGLQRPAPGESDFCTRDGATALKAKIEAYWRDRGQHVMISLHHGGFNASIRAARYDVRSDMVNGMPRTNLKGASQRGQQSAHDDVYVDDFDDDLIAED